MSEGDVARLVQPGWSVAVELGDGIRALRYPGGPIGVEHDCRVVEGTTLVIAPRLRLGSGHTVVVDDPLTVTPSVLCRDCGLHGYIRQGRWVRLPDSPT